MSIENGKILLLDNVGLVNGQGGVEHVLCNMANVLTDSGMQVYIATLDKKSGKPFYDINNNIKFYNLYKKTNILFKIKKIFLNKKNRKILDLNRKTKIWNEFVKKENPDVIICFNLPTLLELTWKKDFDIPIILTVHGNPINDYTNRFWIKSEFENKLYENAYSNASVVQVLLDSYKKFVPESFKGNVVTIANIAPYINQTINYNKQGNKKITCIASLDSRKNQKLLINAFSKIANNYPDWSVELYGSGPDEKELKNIITDKLMQNRIFLKGVTKKAIEVLSDTDIFALPSTCEGWPLVLGESMSMGIPTIGLKECDGVNEIIRHGENGLLCENSVIDFKEKLEILMNNAELRQKYGLAGQNDMKNYTSDIIWGKWKELINSLI